MKEFAIRRSADPSATRAEIDAGAMQALVALAAEMTEAYDWAPPEVRGRARSTGVRWVRSYWHAGGDAIVCLYAGPLQHVVEEANINCGVAFDEVAEVIQVAAPDRTDVTTNHARPSHPDARLFSVECFLAHSSDEEVCREIAELLRLGGAEELPPFIERDVAPEWIRAYRRPEDGWLLALYATTDGAWLDDVPESGLRVGDAVLRPIVEIAPADYLGVE